MKSILLLALLLTGCTALRPNDLLVEAAHTSHLTQHEPFTDHPTNYGYSGGAAYLHWEYKHVYFDIGEEYTIEKLDGMHEVFNARAGFKVPLK